MKALLISTFFLIATWAQNSSSCLKYNCFNGCQSCPQQSYLFQDNQCRYTAKKQGCKVYTVNKNKIVCAQCFSGYYIQQQNCKKSIPNCNNQNSSTCLSCTSDYKLIGNQCISLKNLHLLPAFCTKLDTSRRCSECSTGYILKKQQCVLGSLVCNLTEILKGCIFSSNGQCVTCNPNFLLNGGRCKQIVIPYCLVVNNSVCTKCQLYYTLAGGSCVNDYARSVLNCFRSEQFKCVECIPGYFLFNNSCQRHSQQILIRYQNQFSIYTQTVKKSNKWFYYCSNFDGGSCKTCQKTYVLNEVGQCVKDLSLMKKFSQISTSSSFLNKTITLWWEFSSTTILSYGRQLWYQMSSSSFVTIWGITIKTQTNWTSDGIFIVYQGENGKWICYKQCKIQKLSWNNNIFKWSFYDSIRTNAFRVVFGKMEGNVSLQIEGYYEDPLMSDSQLVSVWPSASVYYSPLTTPTFDHKISQVSTNGGLSLKIISNMYAGFNLTIDGVVRIRRVIISAGSLSTWVTSFILKYSLDGINFYCIDGCSLKTGVVSSSQFSSIRIINPVYCRYMILVPVTYNNGISIRFDFFYDNSLNLVGCSFYSNDGKCQKCKSQYDLTNGVCKIKFPQIVGCKSMNNNNGLCLICQDGYFLNSAGKCPLKSAGCIYTGTLCTSCIEGYVFENSSCSIKSQYLLRMSAIGVKLYSSIGIGSSPLFTDNCQGKGGWIPRLNDTSQWIIMSTSDILKIYKIVITPGAVSWLQSFHLFYSLDMSTWIQYTSPIIFYANTVTNQKVIQMHLTPYISAKSIKIVPLKWGEKGINFNFEAYYYFHKSRGQYYEQNNLTFKSFNDMADVFFSQKVVITEMNTRIGDNGCFTLPSSPNQYLQLSLDEFQDQIANVTTMYVRGSNLRKAWVKSLYFMISRDYARTFTCYKNCDPIMTGLTGPDDLKQFPQLGLKNITDIKIFPLTWQNANSLRIQFAIE